MSLSRFQAKHTFVFIVNKRVNSVANDEWEKSPGQVFECKLVVIVRV